MAQSLERPYFVHHEHAEKPRKARPTTMRAQFGVCRYTCPFDQRTFISSSCLKSLFTDGNIRAELARSTTSFASDSDRESLVQYIQDKARMTFMILVQIERVGFIDSFYKYDFTDKNLRMNKDEVLHLLENTCPSDEARSKTWNVFHDAGFESDKVEDFCKHQWEFDLPSFPAKPVRLTYPKDIVIPIIESEEKQGGGFSNVYKIRIHRDHWEDKYVEFHFSRLKRGESMANVRARSTSEEWKCLKCSRLSEHAEETKVKEMFEQEAGMLQTLAETPHPHLIKYQGAIERGEKWNFIFPWADKGTLQSFWVGNEPDYSNDSKMFLWFIEQLYGLSQALEFLHSKNLRHGDLKPDNILVFAESEPTSLGRLVIADVGLARRHSRATEARPRNPTITMSGTQKYEPPETLARATDARSRVYDTWSMGCICLESIIWLLLGVEGLRYFTKTMGDSRFWVNVEVGHDIYRPCIAPEVSRTFEWLQKKDVRCARNTMLGDLLDFVARRLLVISIKNEDNSNNPPRAEAKEFSEKMDLITRRARYQAHYLPDSARAPSPNLIYTVYQSQDGHLTVPNQISQNGPMRLPVLDYEALSDDDTNTREGNLATLQSDSTDSDHLIPIIHTSAVQPQTKHKFLTSASSLNPVNSVPDILLQDLVSVLHYITTFSS
jgi:serine/threonine protein kinase